MCITTYSTESSRLTEGVQRDGLLRLVLTGLCEGANLWPRTNLGQIRCSPWNLPCSLGGQSALVFSKSISRPENCANTESGLSSAENNPFRFCRYCWNSQAR